MPFWRRKREDEPPADVPAPVAPVDEAAVESESVVEPEPVVEAAPAVESEPEPEPPAIQPEAPAEPAYAPFDPTAFLAVAPAPASSLRSPGLDAFKCVGMAAQGLSVTGVQVVPESAFTCSRNTHSSRPRRA